MRMESWRWRSWLRQDKDEGPWIETSLKYRWRETKAPDSSIKGGEREREWRCWLLCCGCVFMWISSMHNWIYIRQFRPSDFQHSSSIFNTRQCHPRDQNNCQFCQDMDNSRNAEAWTVAVVPDIWAWMVLPLSETVMKFWVFLKASIKMGPQSLVVKQRSSLMMHFGSMSIAKLETSWPFCPWPSKTP